MTTWMPNQDEHDTEEWQGPLCSDCGERHASVLCRRVCMWCGSYDHDAPKCPRGTP